MHDTSNSATKPSQNAGKLEHPPADKSPGFARASDAFMIPWCLVPLADGAEVLFGYALRHSVTGGRAWTRSTAVVDMDASRSRAMTESGRLYALGCCIEQRAIPSLGREAWLAYDLLVAPRAADRNAVPAISTDPVHERRWLGALKMARHLSVPFPGPLREDVDRFIEEFQPSCRCLRSGRERFH